MQQVTFGVMAVTIAIAACSSDAAQTTTTEPAPQSTAVTTIPAPETATTQGPVDICQPQTVLWESGAEYTASCFVLPWSVVAPGTGWRAPGVDEATLLMSWIDPTDSIARVNVAIVVRTGDLTEGMEEILSADGLQELESGSSEVAGHDATWTDVEGRPPDSQSSDGGCAADGPGGVVFKGGSGNGYRIATAPGGATPPDSLGVGDCDIVRIWVLEVEGRTVLIIGGTADPSLHDQAVAKAEELFKGMSFEFSGP